MQDTSEHEHEHDICAICRDPLCARDSAVTLDCQHTFHVECALRWFRGPSQRGECPLCRDAPEQQLNVMDAQARYTILRRKARSKCAPKSLKTHVQKIRSMEEKVKSTSRTLRELLSKRCGDVEPSVTLSQLWTQRRRLKNKRWTQQRRLRQLKRQLGMMRFVDHPQYDIPDMSSLVMVRNGTEHRRFVRR